MLRESAEGDDHVKFYEQSGVRLKRGILGSASLCDPSLRRPDQFEEVNGQEQWAKMCLSS